jgi:hypothetical protein
MASSINESNSSETRNLWTPVVDENLAFHQLARSGSCMTLTQSQLSAPFPFPERLQVVLDDPFKTCGSYGTGRMVLEALMPA